MTRVPDNADHMYFKTGFVFVAKDGEGRRGFHRDRMGQFFYKMDLRLQGLLSLSVMSK